MRRAVQGFLLAASVFLFFCGIGSAGEIDKMPLSPSNREIASRPVQRGMGGGRSERKDSRAVRRGYGHSTPEYAGRNHRGQMDPGNGTKQRYGRDRLMRNDPNQRGHVGGKDYQHRIYGRNTPGYDSLNRHRRTDERHHEPKKRYGQGMYGHDGRKPYGHKRELNYPRQIYGRPYGMSEKTDRRNAVKTTHVHGVADRVWGKWGSWIDRITGVAVKTTRVHGVADRVLGKWGSRIDRITGVAVKTTRVHGVADRIWGK